MESGSQPTAAIQNLMKSSVCTLQHTATRCNTPQHAATHCNTFSIHLGHRAILEPNSSCHPMSVATHIYVDTRYIYSRLKYRVADIGGYSRREYWTNSCHPMHILKCRDGKWGLRKTLVTCCWLAFRILEFEISRRSCASKKAILRCNENLS